MFKNKKTIAYIVAPFLVLGFVSIPLTSYAVNFGGRLVAYVPVIIVPPGVVLCPAHIVVNNVTKLPPTIGIYFPAGAFKYLYTQLLTGANLLFIPQTLPKGAWFLAKFDPVPFPTCPTPYPVVPITTILGFYFSGSSLRP